MNNYGTYATATKWYYTSTTSTPWAYFQRKAPARPQALCATCGFAVPDRDVVEHADLHAAATLAAP